jgi:Fe-S cluster assembly protein SufD
LAEVTLTDTPTHSHGLPLTGSPAERFTSRDPEAFELPSGRDEEWRFTPLAKIRRFFEPIVPDGVIDGENRVPLGAEVQSVTPASLRAFGSALVPADRVSALAMQRASSGLHVQVAAGADIVEPIVLERIGAGGATYAHHVVEVAANARATVVFDHCGSIQVAGNVEVVLGDGASLQLVSINDRDPGSVELTAYAALIGRDATYRFVNVALGGEVVRTVPTVRFAGPGGRAELLGVSFAGAGQHLESRLFIDHGAPNCSSTVLYKNALLGHSARTVWIGDVRIRPAAIGTSTFETNRNLLLSDGARADSVPNLEIETGEITGAGHASATGRFDDLQLFYLRSRGISEAEARRLVVRGFFADVISRIGLPALEDRLMASIDERLSIPTKETVDQ